MILFFLSSGLFLGWSLGANDAANVFGSAVGSRMVRFKQAAIIAGIFVILGAVIQGSGASHTLGKLGAVNAIAGSFTVALSAALTVFWMTRLKVPVSTSQAIVGAIIGWNLYTGNTTDSAALVKITTTWVSGPILGAIFAILLYLLLKLYLKKTKLHLVKRDAYLRTALLIVGAFGSYSLGANNIANVMGVFVPAIPLPAIDFGLFSLTGAQQLFFIGGVAIAIGIFTYSKKVMETVGNSLMPLSGETAMIVVLAHSLVLFVFSSQGLSNFVQSIGLPAIPLVPVSSSQAIVGAIIGLGLFKGGRNIKYGVLRGITLGWITTPLIAGILSFFALFFVNNVFMLEVQESHAISMPIQKINKVVSEHLMSIDSIADFKHVIIESNNITELEADKLISLTEEKLETNIVRNFLPSIAILFIGIISFLFYFIINKQKFKRLQKLFNKKEKQVNILEEKICLLEQDQKNETVKFVDELKFKNKELMDMAISIIQKNDFLIKLKKQVMQFKVSLQDGNKVGLKEFNQLTLQINQNLSIDKDREIFHLQAEQLNFEFYHRLMQRFPNLTPNEKRLCTLLKLNLSSKEIASLLNITPKSVEMNRYRLRKKMNVNKDEKLTEIIREL